MINKILSLNGTQKLNKEAQKSISGSGSGGRVCCEWKDPLHLYCCAWGAGSQHTPCAITVQDPNC